MTGVPPFKSVEEQLRETYGAPNTHIITVSGFTGVGTTTVTMFLCDRFNLDRVDAGQFFRNQADEAGMTLHAFEEAMPALEREQDRDFDLEWDRQALEYAFTRDRFVLEGRLSGALLSDIAPVRIRVTCDRDTVVQRIMEREELDRAEAEQYVETRNQEALARYREKYGIDPRDDRFYNITLDNTDSFDAVKDELLERINAVDVDF